MFVEWIEGGLGGGGQTAYHLAQIPVSLVIVSMDCKFTWDEKFIKQVTIKYINGMAIQFLLIQIAYR